MKILILDDEAAAIAKAAEILENQISQKPASVLGLATGGTMVPLYDCLRKSHAKGDVSFASVVTFNLDEYVGLAPEHAGSYHTYMRVALFDHIDIDVSNVHLPVGNAADPVAESARFEALISASGGIDLQLLGLGQNGHIGFNEPTSSLSSPTRVKTLTQSTRDANRQYFDETEDVPRYAITMGIGTILRSKACLMLATGPNKAKAVAKMVEGPVMASCPASVLQMHAKVTVVLDQAASKDLQLTDYYHHVHPRGAGSEFD